MKEIRRRNRITVEVENVGRGYIVTNVKKESEEKPNGEWITKFFPDDESPLFRKRYYCSVCGEWQTYGKTKFCMNCGADMRGDEADDTV